MQITGCKSSLQNATAKISKLFNWFISEGEGGGRDREKETGNGKGVIGEGETGGEDRRVGW